MGVQGLWDLLALAGSKSTLDNLQNKRVAVDTSMWLVQLLKAIPNASSTYLEVIFTRICKLCHYDVYPVFVFDGTPPGLKQATLRARREKNRQDERDLKRTAERLFLSQMKLKSLNRMRQDLQETNQNVQQQIEQELNILNHQENNLSDDQDDLVYQEQMQDSLMQSDQETDDPEITMDPQTVAQLPISEQLEIIEKQKNYKRASWRTEYNEAVDKGEIKEFSELQLRNYLETSKFNQKIEELRQEHIDKTFVHEIDDKIYRSHRVMSSDADLHYVLYKNEQDNKRKERNHDFFDQILSNQKKRKTEVKSWICSHCFQENIVRSGYCVFCASKKSEFDEKVKDVEVPDIFAKNTKMDIDKELDDILDHIDVGDIVEDPWICKLCSTENPSKNIECSNCPGISQFAWKCADCSLVQKKISTVCSLCSNEYTENRTSKNDTNQTEKQTMDKVLDTDFTNCSSSTQYIKVVYQNDHQEIASDTFNALDDDYVDWEKANDHPRKKRNTKVLLNESNVLLDISGNTSDDRENAKLDLEAEVGQNLEQDDTDSMMKQAKDRKRFLYLKTPEVPQILTPDEKECVHESEDEFMGEKDIHKSIHTNNSEYSNETITENISITPKTPICLSESDIIRLEEEESEKVRNLEHLKRKEEKRVEGMVTSEMIQEVKELLILFGIPWLDSPGEAEAQCSFLQQSGLVDAVISDDCDVFLFGATNVYRNVFKSKQHIEHYTTANIKKHLGLDRKRLIYLALLLGSDYTEGVRGIGIVNALEVISIYNSIDALKNFRNWVYSSSKEKIPFKDSKNNQKHKEYNKKLFRFQHRNVRHSWDISTGFPSEKVIDAYLKPRIDYDLEPFSWSNPNISGLQQFAHRRFGWDIAKFQQHYKISGTRKQRKLSEFYDVKQRLAVAQSKRLLKAIDENVKTME